MTPLGCKQQTCPAYHVGLAISLAGIAKASILNLTRDPPIELLHFAISVTLAQAVVDLLLAFLKETNGHGIVLKRWRFQGNANRSVRLDLIYSCHCQRTDNLVATIKVDFFGHRFELAWRSVAGDCLLKMSKVILKQRPRGSQRSFSSRCFGRLRKIEEKRNNRVSQRIANLFHSTQVIN
jgi:hypothetical protein